MTEKFEKEDRLTGEDLELTKAEKIAEMISGFSNEELANKVRAYQDGYMDLIEEHGKKAVDTMESAIMFRIEALKELEKRLNSDKEFFNQMEKKVNEAVKKGDIKLPSTYETFEGHKEGIMALWIAKGLI